MFIPLTFGLVILSHTLATTHPKRDVVEWESFKTTFGKQYDSLEEEARRLEIFIEHLLHVHDHNSKYAKGEVSFKIGVNHFSDLTLEERQVTRSCLTFGGTTSVDFEAYLPPKNVQVPESVDWREKGAVTPVKNQLHCGSCWAFSTTGALEGQHALKLDQLVSLSEQNLVDCDKHDSGCQGGWPSKAFTYIKKNGIDTEESYPYRAQDDICKFNPKTVGATDKGVRQVPSGDENALKIAVATEGPLSVVIHADDSFQHYHSGVYKSTSCSNNLRAANHAVLLVGYGTTPEGEDFWIVKNSWGEVWGDNGYILMARNHDNLCGIANEAIYPIV